MGVRVWVWRGVVRPCPPVCEDIVTARYMVKCPLAKKLNFKGSEKKKVTVSSFLHTGPKKRVD